jgi:1,4-dihydroxy-2-naphthoate octaprenyltransferase
MDMQEQQQQRNQQQQQQQRQQGPADPEERRRLWMLALKPPMYSVGIVPVLVGLSPALWLFPGANASGMSRRSCE